MGNFLDMLGCMNQFKGYPLAMAACWEPSSFDDGDLVWHVLVDGIVGDPIDARLGHDLTGFEFFCH